jgi:hypothetical protein
MMSGPPPLRRAQPIPLIGRGRQYWWVAVVVLAVGTPFFFGLWINWREYERHWTMIWDPDRGDFIETAEPLPWHESCNQPSIHYWDEYRRPGHVLVYRRIWYFKAGQANPSRSTSGPMSRSSPRPTPHGHWQTVHVDADLPSEHQWYWYGEEISEGEWHLRMDSRR